MDSHTIATELLDLVKALAVAVDHSFMAREHGAAVWKRALKFTAYDVPSIVKKEETKNGTTKKDQ